MAERLVVRPKVNKRDSMGIKAQIQNNNNNRRWQHNVPRLKKARKRTVIIPKHFLFWDTCTEVELEHCPSRSEGGELVWVDFIYWFATYLFYTNTISQSEDENSNNN